MTVLSRAARTTLAALFGVVVLAPQGVAGADPPGPTDYQTTVLAVEPTTPAVEVAIIGGDSFVQLTVERGTSVLVLGYADEPYLRFSADGTVEENRRSPTLAQNEDRFGSSAPVAVDGDVGGEGGGEPEWAAIAGDGRYAWHDHRAHWMSREPPDGKRRGDRIQEGAIPLQVNGANVTVRVATDWMPAPSRLPIAAGAVLAGFAFMVVLSDRRRVAWVLVVAAGAATAIGWWQVRSVPDETGPSGIWWLLPAIAGASGVVAIVLGRSLVGHALAALGGIELALWVYLRRDGFGRSLLPTDAPFWLDRGVTSAAGVTGAIAVAASLIAMFRIEAPRP